MLFVIQGLLLNQPMWNLGEYSSDKEVHISENLAYDSLALLDCFLNSNSLHVVSG